MDLAVPVPSSLFLTSHLWICGKNFTYFRHRARKICILVVARITEYFSDDSALYARLKIVYSSGRRCTFFLYFPCGRASVCVSLIRAARKREIGMENGRSESSCCSSVAFAVVSSNESGRGRLLGLLSPSRSIQESLSFASQNEQPGRPAKSTATATATRRRRRRFAKINSF